MLFFIGVFIQASFAVQNVGTVDEGLDPGRITWWKTNWVSAPITLSKNHAGSDLTLYFNYRVTFALADGIVQVSFPSGVTQASLSGGIYTTSLNVDAGEEVTLAITGVTISTAGTYGPFGLTTRQSSSGQIIDINTNFAYVTVLDSISTSSGLTVTGEDVEAQVNTELPLIFEFTITQDLWAHDVIEIGFSDTYSVSENLVCRSGANVQMLGPDGSHVLPCAATEDSVVIYGLSQDLFVASSVVVSLTVDSFVLPGALSATSDWDVTIHRFGTNTLIHQFSTNTAPVTLTKGAVSAVTWSLVNDLSGVELVEGLEYFMATSFTIETPIPASGAIDILYSGVDNLNPIWYYTSPDKSTFESGKCVVSPALEGTTCTVLAAGILRIVLGQAVEAETEFQVVTLSELGTSPSIVSITTEDDSANAIDEFTEGLTLTLNADYTAVPFDVQAENDGDLTSSTGSWGAGSVAGRYLFFVVDTESSDTLTSLEITCPLVTASTPSVEFFEISIGTLAQWVQRSGAGYTDHTNTLTYDANSIVSVSGNTISVTPSTTDSNYALSVTDSDSCSECMILPLVPSNLATFYECTAVGTLEGVSDQLILGTTRLSVLMAIPDILNVNPFTLTAISGIPFVAEFSTDILDMNFANQDFVVSVVFSSYDLNLGVTSIPIASDTEQNLTGDFEFGTDSSVEITGFATTLIAGDSLKVYIPNGSNIGTSPLDVTVDLAIIDPTFDENFVIFSLSNQFTGVSPSTALTVTIPDDGLEYPGDVSSLTMEITSVDDGAADSWFGFIFPSGTDLDSKSMSTAAGSPSRYVYLTSEDSDFNGNIILVQEDSSFNIETTAVTVSIQDIELPNSAGTFSLSIFESSGVSGEAAFASTTSTVDFTITPFDFVVSNTVSSCKIIGPNGAGITLTVELLVTQALPAGGTVSVDLGGDWQLDQDVDCSSSISGDCSFSGSTATVTLADELTEETTVIISVNQLYLSVASGTEVAYLASAQTTLDGSSLIQFNNTISESCTAESASTIGSLTVTLTASPNAGQFTDTNLYVSFESSVDIPKHSAITLSLGDLAWNWADEYIEDYCWSTVSVDECKVFANSDGVQELYLKTLTDTSAGDDIGIYIEEAIDLNTSSSFITVFIDMSVSWGDTELARKYSAAALKVGTNPNKLLSLQSISLSPNNAGELSAYTFEFRSAVEIESIHDLWIFFPRDYDAFLGDADNYMLQCDKDSYFLVCESDDFPDIVCSADHWILRVSSLELIDASTTVSFTVHGIRNPSAGSYAFKAYQVDDSTIMAYSTNFGSVTIASIPDVLELKNIVVESNEISAVTDYHFHLYLDGLTLSSTKWVEVRFSKVFIFEQDEFDCGGSYYSESSPNALIQWSDTVCQQFENKMTFMANTTETHSYSSGQVAVISFFNVTNPRLGYTREFQDLLYDTEDFDTFPASQYWSDWFEVAVYDSSSSSYLRRSVNSLNAAYLGYGDDFIFTINVNHYDPLSTENRITVYPGTQSHDIPIFLDAWPMASKSLILTPSVETIDNSALISFTSAIYDFTFFHWKDYIEFRVSADRTLPRGLYYISWSVEETTQGGTTMAKYRTPFRTMLEVCEAIDEAFEVTVSEIPVLYAGTTSMPIRVSLENAPHYDLTVNLAFAAESTGLVSVYPTLLTFTNDVSELYFQITVDSTHPGSDTSQVTFTLSGADAQSYDITQGSTLTVVTSTPSSAQYSSSIEVSDITSHSATVTVTATGDGVLYWWLGCKNSEEPGFDEIVENVASLVTEYEDSDPTLAEQLAEYYADTETNISVSIDNTVYDFFWRQFAQHCASARISSKSIYQDIPEVIELEWLYADTDYIFGAYVENVHASNADIKTKAFSTMSSMPVPKTVSATFTSSQLTEDDEEAVAQVFADFLNINPDWLEIRSYSELAGASNSTTSVYVWTLVFDRSHIYYTPTDILSQYEDLSPVKVSLVEAGLANKTSEVTISTSTVSSGVTPSLESESEINFETTSSISAELNYTSSGSGYLCVSCGIQNVDDTEVWQVQVGLSSVNELLVAWTCQEIEAGDGTIELLGLSSSEVNLCRNITCNSYLPWPSCGNLGDTYALTLDFSVLESLADGVLLAAFTVAWLYLA